MKRQNGFVLPVIPGGIPCKINAYTENFQTLSNKDDANSEERETAISNELLILTKLKTNLNREEAKLILLKKLRSSQIQHSNSNTRNTSCQHSPAKCTSNIQTSAFRNHRVIPSEQRPPVGLKANDFRVPCRQSGHKVAPVNQHPVLRNPINNAVGRGSRSRDFSSSANQTTPYHPSFTFHHQQSHKNAGPPGSNISHHPSSTAMGDRQQWSNKAPSHILPRHAVISNHDARSSGFVAPSMDSSNQRKVATRQNLQKVVDKLLYTLRLYHDRSSTKTLTTFMPTNPINFVPSQTNHDFTMLLGLEEVCRLIQKRLPRNSTNEQSVKPIEEVSSAESLMKCAVCGSHCSPYFFRLSNNNQSLIYCSNCLRRLRFEQLEKDHLQKLRQVCIEDKRQEMEDKKQTVLSKPIKEPVSQPYCSTMNQDQLRLCHAQWLHQSGLMNNGVSNPFPASPFLSNAVAAATALAAMTASQQTAAMTASQQTSSNSMNIINSLPSSSQPALISNPFIKPEDDQGDTVLNLAVKQENHRSMPASDFSTLIKNREN